MLKLKMILVLVMCLIIVQTAVAIFINVNVTDNVGRSMVALGFDSMPIYYFFSLHSSERVVVKTHKSCLVQQRGTLDFSSKNLIKCIRTNTLVSRRSLRLIFELIYKSYVQDIIQQVGECHSAVLPMIGQQPYAVHSTELMTPALLVSNVFPSSMENRVIVTKNQTSKLVPRKRIPVSSDPVVVAIDAGHGGHDPGAIGPSGLYEKNVAIAIARKLKVFLDADPMFKPVMTRDGDYFISVMGRSDVARKNGASVLVSIHADAAPKISASGVSVLVLSNRRANSEMANWLEQQEKQSELLGGVGDLLANKKSDPYLSQAVLDLQFGHSQRVGYDIAVKVLRQLQNVSVLHKYRPEYASLGVLRSPDIPSLLVETGFISNIREERLLGSSVYQKKIANALHLGLRAYFLAHPSQNYPKMKNWSQKDNAVAGDSTPATALMNVSYYTIQRGDTLSGIASRYGVKLEEIRSLNKLEKKDNVWVGQQLHIPIRSHNITNLISFISGPLCHKVVYGDTLTAISARYGVSISLIMRANNMKSSNVLLGQVLTIPTG